MALTWMLTITHRPIDITTPPYNGLPGVSDNWIVPRRVLMLMLARNDSHRWIVADEVGDGGYPHWQIRCTASDVLFDWCATMLAIAHVERASDTSAAWWYERKTSRYVMSSDTPAVLAVRYGLPRDAQRRVLRALARTNDRQIVVWYDADGGRGKTWLTAWLVETCQAYYIAPYYASVSDIAKSLASMALADAEHGYAPRPIVVIDIPRSWRWSEQLYTAIEAVKDGLITDPRYSARCINLRGIRVLITANTMPDLLALSSDRWIILDAAARPLS